jgi:hypothetical protein
MFGLGATLADHSRLGGIACRISGRMAPPIETPRGSSHLWWRLAVTRRLTGVASKWEEALALGARASSLHPFRARRPALRKWRSGCGSVATRMAQAGTSKWQNSKEGGPHFGNGLTGFRNPRGR